MMRTISYTVPGDCDGRTVGNILRTRMFLSGSLIKKLKQTGGIYTDDGVCRTVDKLCAGQTLYADIDTEPAAGRKPSFPILFEDEDLLVINKPAGMLVHATQDTYGEITVASEINGYLGEGHFHPVSRLDRGTSGALLIAKNGYTHNLYRDMLHTGRLRRTYRAVICGIPDKLSGEIYAPIGRDSVSPIKRVISQDGKEAITHYRMLDTHPTYSLCEMQPETGRTHQLRLHMAHIGCPIAGDFLYGHETDDIDRCALHSYAVVFYRPMRREYKAVHADMPDDMLNLLALRFNQ